MEPQGRQTSLGQPCWQAGQKRWHGERGSGGARRRRARRHQPPPERRGLSGREESKYILLAGSNTSRSNENGPLVKSKKMDQLQSISGKGSKHSKPDELSHVYFFCPPSTPPFSLANDPHAEYIISHSDALLVVTSTQNTLKNFGHTRIIAGRWHAMEYPAILIE